MELRRLHYFVAVAEEMNFRRAAERLHISQPGLSQQIKVLEEEMGADLFHRDRRGVALTVAGSALLEDSRRLLRDARSTAERVRRIGAGEAGRLRVAHTRSAPELGHRIVKEFRRRHPGVSMTSETAWTSRNVELLRQDEADVAFVRLPLADADDLEVVVLEEVEIVTVMPSSHCLARRRSLKYDELRGESLVLWPREQAPGWYDAMETEIWGSVQPRRILEEPDGEHLLAAVGDGEGIGLLDRERAERHRVPGIVMRSFAPRPASLRGLAWLPERCGPACRRFIELAADLTRASLPARSR